MKEHRKHKKGWIHHIRRHAGGPPHVVSHHKRGIARQFARFRAAGVGGITAFLAVLGPGLLADLSDDDPAGITTQGPTLVRRLNPDRVGENIVN